MTSILYFCIFKMIFDILFYQYIGIYFNFNFLICYIKLFIKLKYKFISIALIKCQIINLNKKLDLKVRRKVLVYL